MPHRETTGAAHFTEPTIIQDIYTTGAAHAVAVSGGCVRLTWYVDIPIFTANGVPEHRIVDRIIVPQEAIPSLQSMLTQAMVLRPIGELFRPRGLVKASH